MISFDFKKNIFHLSAELGVPFGALLSISALATIFADKVPFAGLISMVIMLGAPVVLHHFQRKRFLAFNGAAPFSDIWSLAIFTTLGGALIMALTNYLTISFIRPNFLYEQVQGILDSDVPIDKDMAKTLRTIIEKRAMPSPFEYSMIMFWFIASLGCVGGAITALIARRRINNR